MTAEFKALLNDARSRLTSGIDGETVTNLQLDPTVAAGLHLHAAQEAIDARERALADLDALTGLEPDFTLRRFIGLTAYFGSLWCAYDLTGDFVARVLLDKEKTKDRTLSLNFVSTFFEDGKTPGFLPPPVRDIARSAYSPALGASYALRNACMHQGLVLHTRAFDDPFRPTPELRQIADAGAKRVGGVLPAVLWVENFRDTLRLLQSRTDTLVGILVRMATTMLIEQARLGVVLVERGDA